MGSLNCGTASVIIISLVCDLHSRAIAAVAPSLVFIVMTVQGAPVIAGPLSDRPALNKTTHQHAPSVHCALSFCPLQFEKGLLFQLFAIKQWSCVCYWGGWPDRRHFYRRSLRQPPLGASEKKCSRLIWQQKLSEDSIRLAWWSLVQVGTQSSFAWKRSKDGRLD